MTCEHLLYHGKDQCLINCLGTVDEVFDNNGHYLYKNYKRGDAAKKRRDAERGGVTRIVIGGQGEHEVNALWPIDKAYKVLSNTCENIGGMIGRDGCVLTLARDDGLYELEYSAETSDIMTLLYEIRIVTKRTIWRRD